MFKRSALLVMMGFCSLLAPGQPNLGADIPKIIPPSPNAAAIEKFGTIPVDYSTGVPSISYPMWSWSHGKLSLNVGLSYHAGGNKVQDMAPVTGLGWVLNAGNRVSRTVNGLPDDQAVKGYLYSDVLPQVVASLFDENEYYSPSPFISPQTNFSTSIGYTPYNCTCYTAVKDVSTSNLDGEQDVFSYSVGSLSGRFVFDKQKNLVPLEHSNCKFEVHYDAYDVNSNPTGRIDYFIITDDNGLKYKFDYLEHEGAVSMSDPSSTPGGSSSTGYTSSWLLTSVTDPATNESISYSYSTNQTAYETGFGTNMSYQLESYDPISHNLTNNFALSSQVTHWQVLSVDEAQLNTITLPDGSHVNFQYGFSRADLYNSSALTSVTIKNSYDNYIKRFSLSYSYFESGSGTYFPGFSTLSNDYNKRLRLDKVDELSNDGLLIKPTSFAYNSLAMNPRDSKNLDYWGYHVNPARNNTTYAPFMPLLPDDHALIPYGPPYMDGGDRKPDADYMKAGVLEKISYPTGGYTNFEYECNKAFSSLNYYENRLQTNQPVWQQSAFNTAKSLSLTSRTELPVTLVFKVTELSSRPYYDPNAPHLCLEEAQDNQTASFTITATDNSFTTTVSGSYASFLGSGTTKVIDLPLDKTYTVTFNYNDAASCAYMYPFQASVSGEYFQSMQDKLAGGLRIKTIKSNDGLGHELIKNYSYQLSNGNSSATLNYVPNFGYHRVGTTYMTIGDGPGGSDWMESIRFIERSSSPTMSLSMHNGAPLVYTRVVETDQNGAYIERQFDPIVTFGGNARYPYLPYQDLPNMSGLLIKQTEYNGSGTVMSTEDITYNKSITSLVSDPNNRNIKVGSIGTAVNFNTEYFVADQYFHCISHVEETSRTRKTYENAVELAETTTTSYDATTLYPNAVSRTNSKGESILTEMSYVLNWLGGGTVYNSMAAANVISPKIYVGTSKAATLNGGLQSVKTNYAIWNSTGFYPSTVENNLKDNAYATAATFQAYDSKGNLQQYTAKDGVVNSIIYGYHSQYPVAKIVGKSYSDAVSQSGINLANLDNPTSDAQLRSDLAALRGLSNCQVFIYTYKPLVGVTSETDPNGKTAFYEYDSYNRLSIIRDKDGNVLKKFCYKYDGQPVDCNGLIYENKAMSQGFTKTCSGQPSITVQYVVPAGKYTASSQAAADQLALNDIAENGQAYASAQTCPTAVACNSSNCTGVDKKCINGVCETGVKVCTGTTGTRGNWTSTYHYEWSDSSYSQDYQESGLCLEF